MSAELVARLQRLGAQMLAAAPPVTIDEVVPRRATPLFDPLVRANGVEVPLSRARSAPAIGSRRRPSRRGVVIGSVAAASLLAAALGVAAAVSGDDEDQAVGTAPASTSGAALAPTTTNTQPAATNDLSWPPRLLLGDGWGIVSVTEQSVNEGYMTFQRDGQIVSVGWYRGDFYVHDDAWYQDHGYTEAGSGTLLGTSVPIYSASLSYSVGDIMQLVESGQLQSELFESELDSGAYNETDLIGGEMLEDELSQAIDDGLIEGVVTQGPEAALVQDASSLTVQATANDEHVTLSIDDLGALLETVDQVDAAEWEAALPDSVVTPIERQAVVDEMLSGVTVPDDFGFIGEQALVQDRIFIANEIVTRVACAWLDRYFTASDGDTSGVDRALAAIASIPDWPVSQEVAAAFENPGDGLIPISNTGVLSLTVNDDGTITYEGSGQVLDGYFAAGLCDPNAVG